MSNPSIASKLIALVKGVFGQKEGATATKPAPAPGRDDTQAHAEREAEGTAPAPGNNEATRPQTGQADDSAAEDQGDLVAPGEKAAIAEELSEAEATTQVASDDVLEDVRMQAAPSTEELPVPGYDDLTLPSIRGRLRKLTLDQVRELRSYEVAHANRQEFVKMYDNRITKLQSEGE